MEHKFVTIKDLQRIVLLVENEEKNSSQELIPYVYELAKQLDSNVESLQWFSFPGDNFTLVAIISSSHIVISSYYDNKEKYLDIEIAWCSGKKVSLEEIVKITEKYVKGKVEKGLLLNYKGEIIERL